jgi:hypothetical protein
LRADAAGNGYMSMSIQHHYAVFAVADNLFRALTAASSPADVRV